MSKTKKGYGQQQPAEYYDKIYATSDVYAIKDVQHSPYYELWKKVLKYATKAHKIVDVGCGNGQFAQLCLKNDRQYVLGVDFSSVAIQQARERNPTIADRFWVTDITSKDLFQFADYDTVILCEVVEHIENDFDFLNLIPKGKRVVFTVPNFDSHGHARFFDSIESVVERYKKVFTITDKETLDYERGSQIYLLNCIKK